MAVRYVVRVGDVAFVLTRDVYVVSGIVCKVRIAVRARWVRVPAARVIAWPLVFLAGNCRGG